MTLADLLVAFRVDADDAAGAPDARLWSDADVTRWLNEAVDEACLRAQLIMDRTTTAVCQIAVTAPTAVYALHASIHDIYRAQLTDSGGVIWPLHAMDLLELDRTKPLWRETTRRPEAFIQRDTQIWLDCIVDAAYTLKLEVYRGPMTTEVLLNPDSVPVIHGRHHRHLVNWALYRAYQQPDAETLNLKKSASAEKEFERVFGRRPDADVRKRQQANRPHRNKFYR